MVAFLSEIMCLEQVAEELNRELAGIPAQARIRYMIDFAEQQNHRIVLTTSFGVESALMISLSQEGISPELGKIPIIWIDTGYLASGTYNFVRTLTTMYSLDLRAYQGLLSPARMEALHGELLDSASDEAREKFDYIRSVEPMQRALKDIGASVVLSEERASPKNLSRNKNMEFVKVNDGHLQIFPLLDWTDEEVIRYLEDHNLPTYPLHVNREDRLARSDKTSEESEIKFYETVHRSSNDSDQQQRDSTISTTKRTLHTRMKSTTSCNFRKQGLSTILEDGKSPSSMMGR